MLNSLRKVSVFTSLTVAFVGSAALAAPPTPGTPAWTFHKIKNYNPQDDIKLGGVRATVGNLVQEYNDRFNAAGTDFAQPGVDHPDHQKFADKQKAIAKSLKASLVKLFYIKSEMESIPFSAVVDSNRDLVGLLFEKGSLFGYRKAKSLAVLNIRPTKALSTPQILQDLENITGFYFVSPNIDSKIGGTFDFYYASNVSEKNAKKMPLARREFAKLSFSIKRSGTSWVAQTSSGAVVKGIEATGGRGETFAVGRIVTK